MHYTVVIDTNQYAGNFERQMCAFITGQIGDCGVGEDIADAERANIFNIDWFDANIKHHEDEGCCRPVAIVPTPRFCNNGMGIHYEDTPENRAKYNNTCYPAYMSVGIYFRTSPVQGNVISEICDRAKLFADQYGKKLEITGTRLLCTRTIVEETVVDLA